MGACHYSTLTAKISFIFDPRFFPVSRRTQMVPLSTTIKSLCKELLKLISPGFSRKSYSLSLKIRAKTYSNKDLTLLSDLFLKKGERIFVHVVPKCKDSRMVNVKIHCCSDLDLCVSV